MEGICKICGEESKEIVWLQLYTIGSEGTDVCLNCRMALTRVANDMRSLANRSRLRGMKTMKAGRNRR